MVVVVCLRPAIARHPDAWKGESKSEGDRRNLVVFLQREAVKADSRCSEDPLVKEAVRGAIQCRVDCPASIPVHLPVDLMAAERADCWAIVMACYSATATDDSLVTEMDYDLAVGLVDCFEVG